MKEWDLILRGGNVSHLVSLIFLTFTSCHKCLVNHGFLQDFHLTATGYAVGLQIVLCLVYVYNKDLPESFRQLEKLL